MKIIHSTNHKEEKLFQIGGKKSRELRYWKQLYEVISWRFVAFGEVVHLSCTNPMDLWNITKSVFTTLIERKKMLGYKSEPGVQQ